MQILHLVIFIEQKLREILRHFFCERGNEHSLFALDCCIDFPRDVIYLSFGGVDFDDRIDESGRTDDLFCDTFFFRICILVFSGCGRDVDRLRDALFKLLELERTIIGARRQTKSIFDERLLPAPVPLVHAADLRNAHMGFIDNAEEIFGKVIDERLGRRAGITSGEVTDVVFDSCGVTRFFQHFYVVLRSLTDALRFGNFPRIQKFFFAQREIRKDCFRRAIDFFLARYIVFRGEERHLCHLRDDLSRKTFHLCDGFHFVECHLDSDDRIAAWWENFHGIAKHVEHSLFKFNVAAAVLDIGELAEEFIPLSLFAARHFDRKPLVIGDGAKTVDARYRCHNQDISPREKIVSCGVAEFCDLFVNRCIFFYVRIRVRQVRLRLIVIVVTHEVAHRVLREERLEFAAELSSESFIVRDHKSGAVKLRNHVCHCECFSGTGGAK